MQGVSKEVGKLFMIAKAVFLRSVNVAALVFGALKRSMLSAKYSQICIALFFLLLFVLTLNASV